MDAFIKKIVVACTITLLTLTSVNAIELNKNFTKNGVNLILNGEGTRDKFFIDLYIGGLYLKEHSSNAKQIINNDKTMNIRLHIISSLISSEKMENATREGFEKSTNGNIEPLKAKIESFLSIFMDEIQEGDVYDFLFIPKDGTLIYKNNILKKSIKGLEFKKALYGIWLGEKPAQNSLKKDMLGL